ncbi:MAG: xylulokinase [Lachnospiraceae bacterium]|jgi:xylulokinase
MKKYLIIDMGTSSVRVAIMDDELHIVDAEVVKRVADVTFDAGHEWEMIFELMCRICSRHDNISAVSSSSLLSWVGLDNDLNAVTPCMTYMHQCREEYEAFSKTHDDSHVYGVSLRRMSAENAAFKLVHLKNSKPEIYSKMKCLTTLKDFINAKLTGRCCIDHTFAGYTLLYNVEKACWDEDAIREFGTDIDKLPELERPYSIVGELRPEIAKALGLVAGIPVVCGSVDGSTGILGAGAYEAGTAVSVMGTTDVVFMVHSKLTADKTFGVVTNPHVYPGMWISGGPMGLYGGTVDWFMNTISESGRSIAELTELAAKLSPGSDGLIAFPTLSGERTPFWKSDMKGCFLGMEMKHRPEHIFRSILEANAFSVRKIFETGAGMGIYPDRVIAIGGGSHSDLWLQIKTDVTRIPHYRLNITEATMTGALMLAMLALGTSPDYLPRLISEKRFDVNEDTAVVYDVLYEKYMRVHDCVSGIFESEPK